MTAMLPTAREQLSTSLKNQTAEAHTSAENSQFMAHLSRGKLDRNAVAQLTVQYFHIYSALEAAVRRACDHPAVALIADKRLERVEAITQDLTSMLGESWREVEPLAATARYVAHHYVRYLGDIAGGQVLARVFREAYELPGEALHFYDFSAIGKIPPYRAQYKAALDAMQLGEEERVRLINTAKRAFDLNQAVFQDLAKARQLA